MTREDIKYLTLESMVYHPFLGNGEVVLIKPNGLEVRFQIAKDNWFTREFGENEINSKFNSITELYLFPIKIVAI